MGMYASFPVQGVKIRARSSLDDEDGSSGSGEFSGDDCVDESAGVVFRCSILSSRRSPRADRAASFAGEKLNDATFNPHDCVDEGLSSANLGRKSRGDSIADACARVRTVSSFLELSTANLRTVSSLLEVPTVNCQRLHDEIETGGPLEDTEESKEKPASPVSPKRRGVRSPKCFELENDVVEIVFVRHGLSLNNMIGKQKRQLVKNVVAIGKVNFVGDEKQWKAESSSAFKSGYQQVAHIDHLCGPYLRGQQSSLAWEIMNKSRDCLLHKRGELSAFELGQQLLQILPNDLAIESFFVSPLRRTIETLLATFSQIITAKPSTSVHIQPWIHERYKSDSDLAYDGETVAGFVEAYLTHLGDISPRLREIGESLKAELKDLGDWVDKFGSINPPASGLKVENERTPDNYPLYKRDRFGRLYESERRLGKRVIIIRQWLKNLKPGKRYVLVCHGEISGALFQRKLGNLGVVVARFQPATADPRDEEHFFDDVQLARDKWSCPELAGYQ